MGLQLEVLDYVEGEPKPEKPEDCVLAAWINRYYAGIEELPDLDTKKSLLAGLSKRVRIGGSHEHLYRDGKVLPQRSTTGSQPKWGGDVKPIRSPHRVKMRVDLELAPLRELQAKNGFAYQESEVALRNGIAVFEKAARSLREAHADGIMAQAKETELERVKRENAEALAADRAAQIEDLRNDKRFFQEMATRGGGGRSGGTAVTK